MGAAKTKPAADGATIAQALDAASARLRHAGVDEPRRDAHLLLAAAMGVDTGGLRAWPERPVSLSEQSRFDAMTDRRAAREPVSRILGQREFWSLPFHISPDTLDPRPDSETLVSAVLDRIGDRAAPLTILDLGTGSGCLLLALLHELPNAHGLGVDASEPALHVARRNAGALGLSHRAAFIGGSWGAALIGTWQLIVSNPPYIVSSELPDLAPEVRTYDPPLALAGGADGLDAYRALAPDIARLIAPGGLVALELASAQIENVESIVCDAGLTAVGRLRDIAGNWRCILAEKWGNPAGWRK